MKKLLVLLVAAGLLVGCNNDQAKMSKAPNQPKEKTAVSDECGCCPKPDAPANAVASGSADTIRFAVGWSQKADPAAAADEAVKAALACLKAPAKAIVFYTYFQDPAFKPDESSQATACKADIQAEDKVAATVQQAAAGIPNIGCRARPLVNGGTLLQNAVGVLAVGGEKCDAKVIQAEIQDDRLATGKAVGEALKGVKDLKLVLALAEMRLSFETKDGVSVEDFIKGVLGATPQGTTLFGGNSMPDDMAAQGLAGKQFINGKALKGHVVALGLGGPAEVFGNHANEFSPSAKTAEVTEVEGKWVIKLDGKPAEQVYRELTGMKADDKLSSDWLHPIGVDLGNGKSYTRMILNWSKGGKDKDGKPIDVPDGSLMFVAPVVKGTEVFCLACQQKPEPILASAKATTAESVEAARQAGTKPALALLSNCCARGMRLRTFTKGGDDEVKQAILPALGEGVPVFGFYAWGELGQIKGKYQDMNHQYQQHTFVSALIGLK